MSGLVAYADSDDESEDERSLGGEVKEDVPLPKTGVAPEVTGLFGELPCPAENGGAKKKKKKRKKKRKGHGGLPLLEQPTSIDSDSDGDFEQEDKDKVVLKDNIWQVEAVVEEELARDSSGPQREAVAPSPLDNVQYERDSEQVVAISDHDIERMLKEGKDVSAALGSSMVRIREEDITNDAKSIATSRQEELEVRKARSSGVQYSDGSISQSMKRSNQITSLAARAGAMEGELQERWSAAKKARSSINTKYGW
mmetsp:Transcript_5791/g.9004  ORF Transcript_5791/g.9004 Transcript_5791/m.9004 type:complete len:254 (-) Transcript_5791:66-827(-)